jgi:uncharacterized caspase-like protein
MRQILFGLFILVPTAVDAQRNLVVSGEARVALVIGNSEYKNDRLANPVNDARDMAQALERFGFKVLLKTNADTREMRRSIREFGAEMRRAQVGLFYFAGHGVQLRGDNYLIPVGAEIDSEAEAEDLAISANFVLRTMEESQVPVSIVILDACRNNPFVRSFRSSTRGLAHMQAATGSLIAFATAPGSVAADGTGRNGTYTKHLLASLNQPDTDILKVFQRTRAAVVKETAGKQTPWESTSLIGDFYFRSATTVGAAATTATTSAPDGTAATMELAFWGSIKASRNVADFKDYLDKYPNGRFAELARNRIAALSERAEQVASTKPQYRGPAGVQDVSAVPYLKDKGRKGYEEFLTQPLPRAFALAPNGAWGWAQGGHDPEKRALDNCNRHANGACKTYAIGHNVVWRD